MAEQPRWWVRLSDGSLDWVRADEVDIADGALVFYDRRQEAPRVRMFEAFAPGLWTRAGLSEEGHR